MSLTSHPSMWLASRPFKMYMYGLSPSHNTVKGEHTHPFTIREQITSAFQGPLAHLTQP